MMRATVIRSGPTRSTAFQPTTIPSEAEIAGDILGLLAAAMGGRLPAIASEMAAS